jgi:DNA-directed RNA polymerase specialized sigma24 family protein
MTDTLTVVQNDHAKQGGDAANPGRAHEVAEIWYAEVLRIVRARYGYRRDWTDIAQEVMVKILTADGALPVNMSHAWLHRTITNTVLNINRTYMRKEIAESLDQPDALRSTARSDYCLMIDYQEVVDELPEDFREAFVSVTIEGSDPEDYCARRCGHMQVFGDAEAEEPSLCSLI